MSIKFKKLYPDAKCPTYATDGAAAFDFYAWVEYGDYTEYVIAMRDSFIIDTGIAVEIPPGFAMLIFSRSGHGFRDGIRLANCVGVIDSDYRGEIKVALHNDSDNEFAVRNGDRIAQGIIIPVSQVQFVLVDELSDTKRGTGGLGSTGR